MRFLKFAALAAMVGFLAPAAEAGVFGSALFSTFNMRVQRSNSLNGPYTNISPGGITVASSTLSVLNTVNLNSNTVQTSGNFPSPVPSADTAQAFITSGLDAPPGQNTFTRTTPLPATSAFSRADALTTGTLLTAGGLSTRAVSEIEAFDLSLGDSTSSTGATSLFNFTSAQDGFFRLKFDANVDLLVSSTGPPALRFATATNDLIIQINGAVASLDSQFPAINHSLSGTAGTGPLSFTGVTTTGIFLRTGIVHGLSITHLTTASVQAVPEPSTVLAFSALMAIGGIRRLRRKRS